MPVERRFPVNSHSLNVAEFECLTTRDGRRTAGGTSTLVLLHGVTRRWQSFLPILPTLQQRHRLLLVDLRGHGRSDRAADSYFVCDYITDIVQLLRQHVEGPVHLYGHSLGAMTAAGVAAELPQQVQSAVLEDPPFHTMGDRIFQTSLHSYFANLATFAGHGETVEQAARSLGESTFSDPETAQVFRLKDHRSEDQLRFAAESLAQLDPAVFDSILSGQWLQGYDIDQIFGAIRSPVLVLQADPDAGGMLIDNDVKHVQSLNSQIRCEQFPGQPHGLHWMATDAVTTAVQKFHNSI